MRILRGVQLLQLEVAHSRNVDEAIDVQCLGSDVTSQLQRAVSSLMFIPDYLENLHDLGTNYLHTRDVLNFVSNQVGSVHSMGN
jgi:hypothetical protein